MRSNRVRLVSLAVGLSLVLAACGGGGSSESSGSGSGDEAAAFSAETLEGAQLDSASFAGKDTVLWFWAPWCTVCRGEAPDVTATAADFEGEVEVIGVAGRGEVPEMNDFVSDTGTGDLTHVVDESGDIWSSYEVISQPAYAFINDDGTYEVVTGALGREALAEKMDALAAA